ncbi:MAG TPA: hypothetical protein P5232_01980 [Candidatus Moranbacteria bacterium]|nr:hypothetical protein [Candidatus Moranbacteria bacterium]
MKIKEAGMNNKELFEKVVKYFLRQDICAWSFNEYGSAKVFWFVENKEDDDELVSTPIFEINQSARFPFVVLEIYCVFPLSATEQLEISKKIRNILSNFIFQEFILSDGYQESSFCIIAREK